MRIVHEPNLDAAAISDQANHISFVNGHGIIISDVRRVKCSRACRALLYVHKQTLNQKLQVDLWELHWSILLRFGDYPFDDAAGNSSYHLTVG